jgi:hypothetical protein
MHRLPDGGHRHCRGARVLLATTRGIDLVTEGNADGIVNQADRDYLPAAESVGECRLVGGVPRVGILDSWDRFGSEVGPEHDE